MSRTSTAKTEFGCKITDMLDSVHSKLYVYVHAAYIL